jgi:methylmalonyl-CoA mutase C-terminal domain/subunit
MDAGMEVIYTGPRQTADTIVSTALQEDVDLLGLSFLTGSHKEHTQKIVHAMKEKGLELARITSAVGGIIPPKDLTFLKSIGVDAVFGPGSDTDSIIETLIESIQWKRGNAA